MKEAKIINRGEVAEVQLYDVIGEDPWFGGGISAKTFRDQIKGIKAKTINLRINSPGGSVTEGAAMLNTLDEFPGRIEVDIDGMSASSATFIMMAGDVIRAASNSLTMIHEAAAGQFGRAEDMRRLADLLDKVNGQIIDAYTRRAKPTRAELAKMMADETWMTGKEAVDFGFADSVTSAVPVAAFAEPFKFAEKLKFKNAPAVPAASADELAKHKARLERIDRLRVSA